MNFPELINEEIINRYKKIPVATISDGMQKLGLYRSGSMDAQIGPVKKGMKVIGTAMTVETDKGNNLPIHIATYGTQTPGYVMVINGNDHQDCAYIGDLICSACDAVGYAGIVLDGYSRDSDDLGQSDFPVFSKGFMPSGPNKGDAGKVNVTIQCGGISVNPGDLIYGDDDGVVVIPQDKLIEVIEAAETKLEYEGVRVKEIEAYKQARLNNQPLPDLAPPYVTDYYSKFK